MGRQRLIELSNQSEILAHQANVRKMIRDAYTNGSAGEALLITKAEFVEQFSAETHEIFGLKGLDRMRQDLIKADSSTAEEAFKAACAGLKGYVVTEGDHKNVVYVREKKKLTE